MSKKNKKSEMKKTQVEQILDKSSTAYEQAEFPTYQDGDVCPMSIDHTGVDEYIIHKTLVLAGNVTGPLVGVIPVGTHLDEKKLAKIPGNKKVNMVPPKNLLKTTGYVHGVNAPVGIYEELKYPIFTGNETREQGDIFISLGKVGHSIKLNVEDLATLVHVTFASLKQEQFLND